MAAVSKQEKWHRRNRAAGLCADCGQPVEGGGTYCARHSELRNQRRKDRRANGQKPLEQEHAEDAEARKFHENFDLDATEADGRDHNAPREQPAANGNGAQSGAAAPGAGSSTLLEVKLIDPSPFQPRKDFNAEALKELAESLRKNGLLQEICVRRVGKRFELLYGERRLRAAKLNKWPAIPAKIRDVTDEEAVDIVLAENLKRKDLNAIDEARGYEIALKHGEAKTEEALAKRLGISQGQISNRLRLLRLPEPLQAAVIDGKLPPTHARELIPHCDKHPRFGETFAKALAKQKWELWPLSNFDDQIYDAWCEGFEECYTYEWGIDQKKLREKHRDELEMVEVDGRFLTPHKSKWKALVAAEKKARDRRQGEKLDRGEAKGAKKLTAAEEKARQKELEKQQAKRVNRWFVGWLQARIAERLPQRQDVCLKLKLHFMLSDSRMRRVEELHEVAKEKGLDYKPSRAQFGVASPTWKALAGFSTSDVQAATTALLQRWVQQDFESWAAHLTEADIRAISREMGIDVAKEWMLDESFLQLFPKSQLVDLAKEWGLLGRKGANAFTVSKRGELIRSILEQAENRKLPTPAVLLSIAKKG